MPQVLVEEVVAAKRMDLYRLAQDFRHRLEWDSFAKRVKYDHGAVTSQIGLAGSVSIINPFRMTIEHFTLIAPALAGTNMLSGPFFFSKLIGSWRFEEVEDGLTRVTLQYQFKSRWLILSRIFDPLLRRILENDFRRALRDLKQAAEETDILHRIGHR